MEEAALQALVRRLNVIRCTSQQIAQAQISLGSVCQLRAEWYDAAIQQIQGYFAILDLNDLVERREAHRDVGYIEALRRRENPLGDFLGSNGVCMFLHWIRRDVSAWRQKRMIDAVGSNPAMISEYRRRLKMQLAEIEFGLQAVITSLQTDGESAADAGIAESEVIQKTLSPFRKADGPFEKAQKFQGWDGSLEFEKNHLGNRDLRGQEQIRTEALAVDNEKENRGKRSQDEAAYSQLRNKTHLSETPLKAPNHDDDRSSPDMIAMRQTYQAEFNKFRAVNESLEKQKEAHSSTKVLSDEDRGLQTSQASVVTHAAESFISREQVGRNLSLASGKHSGATLESDALKRMIIQHRQQHTRLQNHSSTVSSNAKEGPGGDLSQPIGLLMQDHLHLIRELSEARTELKQSQSHCNGLLQDIQSVKASHDSDLDVIQSLLPDNEDCNCSDHHTLKQLMLMQTLNRRQQKEAQASARRTTS